MKMSILFITVTLIILICFAVNYFAIIFRRRQLFIKAVNSFPGPKAFPLIGSALYFWGKSTDGILQIGDKLVNNFPSPFRIWFVNFAYILIYDINHAKIVLQSKCLEKSSVYKIFEPALGKGLLISPVSVWNLHRKMIGRIFANNLQQDFDILIEQSLAFVNELKEVEQNEIIFLEFISRYTFNIAFEKAMGIKLESQLINRIIKATNRIKNIWTVRISNIFLLYPDVVYKRTALGYLEKKEINLVKSILNEIIQKKACTFNECDIIKSNRRITLFDILLKAFHKKTLTEKEIFDHITTLIFAASDTTAVALNFVIFMLANFPEIQEKAYKELSEIYGIESPTSVPVKYEDLQNMDYLNRIIKETMRLFPPIPVIGRSLTKDLKIEETILPKGANILISILHVHRNKKHWLNPLIFDPDRFLPGKEVDCSRSFLPFSIGLRNCIGQKYTMMSAKVILATLIRTFEFKVDKSIKIEEIELNMDIVLKTVNPLKIKIKRRDN